MTASRKPRAARDSKLSPDQISEVFTRLRDANPHPTTELEYTTPFELLVAVVLSAQATGLKGYINTIGLYNAKAANVIALCRQLLDLHAGEVPRTRDALEALPGVGRKTANVVLNTAFGEPTIAVDTHIFRVANRTGLAPGKDVRTVEDKLVKLVPGEFARDAHHWLILHGRYMCKARKPDCLHCPIHDLCRWPDKGPSSWET